MVPGAILRHELIGITVGSASRTAAPPFSRLGGGPGRGQESCDEIARYAIPQPSGRSAQLIRFVAFVALGPGQQGVQRERGVIDAFVEVTQSSKPTWDRRDGAVLR